MSITALYEKSNAYFARIPRDVRVVVLLLSAMIVSFALGYAAGFSGGKEAAVAFFEGPQATSTGPLSVVASKGGTKYYLPWCAGADRIRADNKVWFSSPHMAEAHGYDPASNCDGL